MKKVFALVLALCMLLASVGAIAEDAYTIVVMPKQVGIPYFEAARGGVDAAGETLGVNAVFNGPNVADAAQQVSMIQDLISQGVDAIAISANDAAALTPVLTQAKEAGIVVLDWDSPADPAIVQLSVKEIDYEQFAQYNWDEMVKHMGTDEGEYVILTSTLTAGSCNAWIEYGLAYAAEKYPNLTLVCDPVCTNESVDEAYSKTLDLLTTYPDLKGIMGTSSFDAPGVARAIQEMGLVDKAFTTGTGMPADNAELLKSGVIKSLTLWDPAIAGQAMIALAVKVLNKETISGPVDLGVEGYTAMDFRAGSSTVLEGQGWITINAENVDSFGF